MTRLNEKSPIDFYIKTQNILKDMADKKIFFPYMSGKNLNLVKKLKYYSKKQLELSHNYEIYENTNISRFNDRIYNKMLDLNNDSNEILDLNKFAIKEDKKPMDNYNNKKLIIQCVKFYSNYNGNHGSYNVYYIQKNKLNRIFIKSLDSFSKIDHLYHKHGGNYSFEEDLKGNLSYIVSNDRYFFNYDTL